MHFFADEFRNSSQYSMKLHRGSQVLKPGQTNNVEDSICSNAKVFMLIQYSNPWLIKHFKHTILELFIHRLLGQG